MMVRPRIFTLIDLAEFVVDAQLRVDELKQSPQSRSWNGVLNEMDRLHEPMALIACEDNDGIHESRYIAFREAFHRHRVYVDQTVEPAVLRGAANVGIRHRLAETLAEVVRCAEQLTCDTSFGRREYAA